MKPSFGKKSAVCVDLSAEAENIFLQRLERVLADWDFAEFELKGLAFRVPIAQINLTTV